MRWSVSRVPTRTARSWSVVAKGGVEEGVDSLADTLIVAPSGEILACRSRRRRVVVADCDLDWCRQYTGTLFDMTVPPSGGVRPDRRTAPLSPMCVRWGR